jgi:hypothetical protein
MISQLVGNPERLWGVAFLPPSEGERVNILGFSAVARSTASSSARFGETIDASCRSWSDGARCIMVR